MQIIEEPESVKSVHTQTVIYLFVLFVCVQCSCINFHLAICVQMFLYKLPS